MSVDPPGSDGDGPEPVDRRTFLARGAALATAATAAVLAGDYLTSPGGNDAARASASGSISSRAFTPGSGLVDETDGLLEAFRAAERQGAELVIEKGVYLIRCDAIRLTTPGMRVRAHAEALFKPSGNGVVIAVTSSTPERPELTHRLARDGRVGARTVVLESAAGLAAGDRVTLRDDRTLGGEEIFKEVNVVAAVDGATVRLEKPLGHAYRTSSSAGLAKVDTLRGVSWRGGRFDLSAVAGGLSETECNAIHATWVEDSVFAGVRVVNHPDKGVAIFHGLGSHIRDVSGGAPARTGPGDGYMAQLLFSRECTITGGRSENVRHHADIVGGQHCGIIGGSSRGRVDGPHQAGASLHGMHSRWCFIRGFQGTDLVWAALAGNGAFDSDFDFTIEDVRSDGCDKAVVAYRSKGRIVRPVVRRPRAAYPVDVTNEGAEVDVIEPDIDMRGTTFTGLGSSGLVAGARLRFRGGVVRFDDESGAAAQFGVPAGASLTLDGVEFDGRALRAVHLRGPGAEQTLRGCAFRGAYQEVVRAEDGEVRVEACDFAEATTVTAVRAAGTCRRITVRDNDWGPSENRVFNTADAVVTGAG